MTEFDLNELLELRDSCGSCRKFVTDFIDKEKRYGHCGIKPRRGSILAEDFKCPHYEMEQPLRDHLGLDDRPRVRQPLPDLEERSPARRRALTRKVVLRKRERPDDTTELEFLEMDRGTFKRVVGELLDEMLGIEEVEMGDRWRGGTLSLVPANRELQSKDLPIEMFFKKIIMLRERLRVLEQKINNHKTLEQDEKIELQQYLTRCYGSLTTFNVLFADKDDYFVGDKS